MHAGVDTDLEVDPRVDIEDEFDSSPFDLCKRFGIGCKKPTQVVDCRENPSSGGRYSAVVRSSSK